MSLSYQLLIVTVLQAVVSAVNVLFSFLFLTKSRLMRMMTVWNLYKIMLYP